MQVNLKSKVDEGIFIKEVHRKKSMGIQVSTVDHNHLFHLCDTFLFVLSELVHDQSVPGNHRFQARIPGVTTNSCR